MRPARRAALAVMLALELIAAAVLLVSVPAPVTGHRLVPVSMGGPRTDELLARVAAEFPAATDAVVRFWGSDWQRDIVVVAAGSQEQFIADAGLDPSGQWTDIAAVAVADSVDPAARRADGQRIVLAPGASAMSDAALRVVLAHELFHIAARAGTATDAPRWLTEGVADYVARPPDPVPPGASADTALPSDAELDAVGPQRSAGYDRAWWFARFVADDHGADGLRRLYVRACGPNHADFAVAVHEALGIDIDELRAGWARWLSR